MDRKVVVNFACGIWCGVQWTDLQWSLWDATLEVVPVSGVGFAPLEMAHTAQVWWAPLELAGGVLDVVAWSDSAYYFSIL